MSIHPTMTNAEVEYIMDAIEAVANNHGEWSDDYNVDLIRGVVQYKEEKFAMNVKQEVDDCFETAFAWYIEMIAFEALLADHIEFTEITVAWSPSRIIRKGK